MATSTHTFGGKTVSNGTAIYGTTDGTGPWPGVVLVVDPSAGAYSMVLARLTTPVDPDTGNAYQDLNSAAFDADGTPDALSGKYAWCFDPRHPDAA